MFIAAVVVVGGLTICNCIPILLNAGLYVRKSSAAASSEPGGCSRYASHRGPIWLSISNRCSSVSYIKHPRTWLAWDLIDPLHLVASYWVPPACLLAVRFCLLLHLAARVLLDSLLDGDITPAWLLAFKNWSAILVGCTGLLGCMVSLKYMTSCAHQSASPRISLGGISHLKRHQSDLCDIKTATLPDGWEADPMAPDMASEWGLADKLYLLSVSTAAPAAILVPALYWPKGSVCAAEYALQSTAVALLLWDVMLSRAPFVSYHSQVLMLFCSAYVATVWVDHAATGLWLVSRLDWSKASCIIYYVGLLLLVPVSWFAWYLLACIRETLGGVCLQGKASAGFITTMTAMPEAKCKLPKVTMREPSFALWTKEVDHDSVQITTVTLDSDITVQPSASPHKEV